MSDQQTTNITFPDRLVGLVELSRVIRELEMLNESLHQASIRTPGSKPASLPKTSKLLDETAELNKVSLLDGTQREQLLALLKACHEHAPKIHISFAGEPTAKFTSSLVNWMRQNISPIVLVQIGLQPTIIAGCVVRTTNKQFDMSLKKRFIESRPILVQKLSEVVK